MKNTRCPLPFLSLCFALTVVLSMSARAEEAKKVTEELIWYDVATWGVEGQGWQPEELAARYDRLPAKAEGVVRGPVWSLSRNSAGLSFRFNTDTTKISIRYEVVNPTLGMVHMPATGVSGVDLYALDDGTWKWVDVTKPTAPQTSHTISGIDPGKRTWMGYLPLYNSTKKIEIGVPKGSIFEPITPRKEKPIVFYGTSIQHGACASRPGMPHPAILGRRLDRPVINLGFSGNGKMEPEVGALLAEIDAALYVIDCLPNMTAAEVAELTEPLVRQLRKARPDAPIILVEDRTYGNAWIMKEKRERHENSRAALTHAYDTLIASGEKNLYYIPGADLLGTDNEATTDGSHPSDLGFMRQADAMEPILRKALGMK